MTTYVDDSDVLVVGVQQANMRCAETNRTRTQRKEKHTLALFFCASRPRINARKMSAIIDDTLQQFHN